MSEPIPPVPTKIPELLAPAGSAGSVPGGYCRRSRCRIFKRENSSGPGNLQRTFPTMRLPLQSPMPSARGVRVYVTVNTLIHDRELVGAAGYLVRLYTLGADAVLIQGPGPCRPCPGRLSPTLSCMHRPSSRFHNAEGVRWAYGQGFSRVVLARELSLTEIEGIAEAVRDIPVGLEIFAHGALCYSYSGQCLLSSVIGGRSGNRGMCAQTVPETLHPCRRKDRQVRTARRSLRGAGKGALPPLPKGPHDLPGPPASQVRRLQRSRSRGG